MNGQRRGEGQVARGGCLRGTRRRRAKLALHGAALAIAIGTTAAAVDKKPRGVPCPVAVVHSGEDAVGQRFAYALRERIRGSSKFRLAGETEASLGIISLLSIDTEQPAVGRVSAVAVQYTAGREGVAGEPERRMSILIVGRGRVADQAERVLAQFDTFFPWVAAEGCVEVP
jgi:hypothetical protein